MELSLQTSTLQIATLNKTRQSRFRYCDATQRSIRCLFSTNPVKQVSKAFKVSSALAETAVSVAVAATIVGTAATLLVKRTKSSETTEAPLRTCEDCGGSGICSECKGEGFVLKKLSEESAEKARLMAKNAATRYTAGLPKKWSYCTKCSSSRSCNLCGGTGKLSY